MLEKNYHDMPEYEYVMSRAMAKEMLGNRMDEDKKKRPNDYLMEVINNEFGIMGTCVKVSFDD